MGRVKRSNLQDHRTFVWPIPDVSTRCIGARRACAHSSRAGFAIGEGSAIRKTAQRGLDTAEECHRLTSALVRAGRISASMRLPHHSCGPLT